MDAFISLTGIAAPLPVTNVDTDMIIPKQYLKSIKRTGFGVNLFDEMRYTQDGSEVPDFILNQEPYRQAKILVTGENFGCGSSREHAPWALLDFGIRCVIAPSYADIFFNNCFKNGILPITLPQAQIDALMEVAASEQPEISVDLEEQKIIAGNQRYDFEVDAFRKHCLLNGLDDIGQTLEKEAAIARFEGQDTQERPWLFG